VARNQDQEGLIDPPWGLHAAGSKVCSFRQWAATTCTAPPGVIAGQYATSNCKLLVVMFM